MLLNIFWAPLTAQVSEIDSLEQVLISFTGDSEAKGNLLIELSNVYKNTDTAKMRSYIDDALILAQKEGLKNLEKRAYMSFGNYYWRSAEYFLAYINYKNAEKICIELNDIEYLARVYYNMLRVFNIIMDAENMVNYANKFLETGAKLYDLTTLLPHDTTNIVEDDPIPGWLFWADYLKRLALIDNELSLERLIFHQEMLETPMFSHPKLLEMKKLLIFECGLINISLKKPRESLKYFQISQELCEQYAHLGTTRFLTLLNISFAEAHSLLQQIDSAIYYLDKTDKVLPYVDHQIMSALYSAQIELETAKGDYKKAYEISQKYYHFADSIQTAQKSEDMARMKNWLELEQKDIENAILQEEKIIQQKLLKLLSISLLCIFALLPFSFFYYRKIIKKKNELNSMHTFKDKLFSIVSNDLRAPIHSLAVTLKLANSMGINAKNRAKILKNVSTNVDNTYGLIENLLIWAKSQMHATIAKSEHVNIQTEINFILDDLSNFAEEKNIFIENNIGNYTIDTDKEMFKIILRNLIFNALKYTHPYGKIIINSELDDHHLIISVSDTGIGMSPEIQGKLFHLSETKGELGTNSERGTGLGLVLCAELIKKIGGKIWFESKMGEGSIFYISLRRK